ncbi:MAG: hypothetical protein LM550_02930 [Candidatus Contendobacter sp.]|jgi:hypothetical protein|nr:hypothetical protein [Candidatus Contendobacter sp.]
MAELIWIDDYHSTLPPILKDLVTTIPCDKLGDLRQHSPTSSSLLVALPATYLDDTVAGALQEFADKYPDGIGLLPTFSGEVNASLLQPDLGKAADSLTWAAISAHERNAPLGAGLRPISNPLVIADRLREGPLLDIFAGVLNGRQTFVHLDSDLLLHPGVPIDICQSACIVSSLKAKAHHWLIQSCHSPFIWSDFGEYLTVPLALAKNLHAKSILVSTRVQTYIPRALEIYAQMAVNGNTMGAIVRALNAAAKRHGCDVRPFILLGNPDTIIAKQDKAAIGYTPLPYVARETADAIARIAHQLCNLVILVDGQYLNFKAADGTPKQFRALVHQIKGEFNHRRESLRSYIPQSNSLVDRWNSLATNNHTRIQNLANLLGVAWTKGIGYYYHPSDAIESHYIPIDASLTEIRCASCGSLLYQRTLVPASVGKTWRADRVQFSCPRCLVVLDASADLATSIKVTTKRDADAMYIAVQYQNNSSHPQLILPIAHWNDPNNLSVRASRNRALADKLLGGAVATAPAPELFELPPKDTVEWSATISLKAPLFYCLFELNLFVDFEWNWLSATLRQPRISDWLKSIEYHRAIDSKSN